MKRDMDLIRDVLIAVEDDSNDPNSWIDIELPEHNSLEISYHIMLLDQAGLLDAIDLSTKDGSEWKARSLTWAGHEFLDSARDEKLWNSVKKSLGKRVASASFELVKEVLISEAKRHLLGN